MQVVDIDKPKKKGGRPRKPLDKLRVKQANVWMTEAEYAAISEGAAKAGMTIPDYLLVCSSAGIQRHETDDDPVPPVVPALNLSWVGKLAHLSNNLNQIARHANQGNFADSKNVISACYQLHSEVKKLRAQLMGVSK